MKGIYQHDPVPLDQSGKIRTLLEETFEDPTIYKVRVNLGCGADYLNGYINIDGDTNVKAEIHMELDDVNVHIPLDDESVDYIYASHILEHIQYLPQLKKELIRVLRPAGVILVLVPHMLSPDAWGDDTHCRAFSPASFSRGFWPGCEIASIRELNIQSHDSDKIDRVWIGAIIQKKKLVTVTTEYCKDCGWCCFYSNHPVPVTDNQFKLDTMLELYYKQGHDVYYESQNGKWYVLMSQSCQHLTGSECDIYGTGTRPTICKTFICPAPGRMHERYETLVKASKRILEQKFKRGGE